MKHAILGAVIAAMLVGLMACGGSSTSAPSGLTHRVLVSNSLSTGTFAEGTIQIVDASKNLLSGSTITAGSAPGLMAVDPLLDRTLVFDSSSNEVSILVNSTESDAAFITLPGFTESLIDRDINTGFAAIPDLTVSSAPPFPQPSLGGVALLDLVDADLAPLNIAGINFTAIPVPGARHIVMGPMTLNSSNQEVIKLLVFSDNYRFNASGGQLCSDGSTAMTVIDITPAALVSSTTSGTAAITNLPIVMPFLPATVCGFDQAVSGVFGSDGTAYILNCGPECGGTTASVQPLVVKDLPSGNSSTPIFASNPPLAAAIPVRAATVGMLNGSTLYVAGTPNGTPGPSNGVLSVLNVSGSTPGVTVQQPIGDGYHTLMTMGANNELFVGATGCTNNDPNASTPTGCLSIYNAGTNSKPIIDSAKGFVTGMVAIANSNLVYVIEGNRLNIYDTTTSAISTTITPINIVGTLIDVKAIDQPQP